VLTAEIVWVSVLF